MPYVTAVLTQGTPQPCLHLAQADSTHTGKHKPGMLLSVPVGLRSPWLSGRHESYCAWSQQLTPGWEGIADRFPSL